MASIATRGRGSCLGRFARVAGIAGLLLLAVLAIWSLVNTPPPAERVTRDHLTERDLRIVRESPR